MVNDRNFSSEFQGQPEEASHFDTVACSLLEDEGIVHLDSQKESHEMNQQSNENLHTHLLEINEDIHHPCESLGGKEDNYHFSKRKQKVLSPLFEDEIDQLLKSHVTAQANADDRVVMFNNLEKCFLFKNDLDY